MMPFPYLLLPSFWSSRNRARRRERGDALRLTLFGAVGLAVLGSLFAGSFWVTLQLDQYAELGDFLLRLGLSWLFLTLLSNFFLSDDLRLLLAAPIDIARLFYARFLRTLGQSTWMVLIFLLPVLVGVGVARCAPAGFYLTSLLQNS